MRIITGRAKGTKLFSPKGYDVRPTADRVKESIFNIIGGRTIDAMVLDLFAGTGNLGLEALSRGAKQVVFVDNNSQSIRLIEKNIEVTHFQDFTEIFKMDVIVALRKLHVSGSTFDLIYCDPPYNRGYVEKVTKEFVKYNVLTQKGWLLLEHSKHEEIVDLNNRFRIVRVEEYGETRFTIICAEYDL